MDPITVLATRLGEHLRRFNAQVTTAESCTGGGIAEAITRVPGSSAWFEAGYVTYSNAQKTRQLNVPAALFAEVGAVSQKWSRPWSVVPSSQRRALCGGGERGCRAGRWFAGQTGGYRVAGLG